jgi:hypothetical protein
MRSIEWQYKFHSGQIPMQPTNINLLKRYSAALLIVLSAITANPAVARGGGGGGGHGGGGGGHASGGYTASSHSSEGHTYNERGYRGYRGGGYGYGYGGYGYGGYGNNYYGGGGGGYGGYGGGGGFSATDAYNMEEDKRRKNLPSTSFVHEYHWPVSPPGTNTTSIASGTTPQFAKAPKPEELTATAAVGDFSKVPADHTASEGSVHGILIH